MKRCDNTSVGMLVWRQGWLLLIERAEEPFGFAPPAGHLDGDTPEAGAARELHEETGLVAEALDLVAEGRKDYSCGRPGGGWHHWHVFSVRASGELHLSAAEAKRGGWYSLHELARLAARTRRYLAGEIGNADWELNPGIEPVWLEWFGQLGTTPRP